MEIFRFFVIGRKISFSTQSDLQQSAVVVKVVVQLRNILGKRYQDMIQELIFNIKNLNNASCFHSNLLHNAVKVF